MKPNIDTEALAETIVELVDPKVLADPKALVRLIGHLVADRIAEVENAKGIILADLRKADAPISVYDLIGIHVTMGAYSGANARAALDQLAADGQISREGSGNNALVALAEADAIGLAASPDADPAALPKAKAHLVAALEESGPTTVAALFDSLADKGEVAGPDAKAALHALVASKRIARKGEALSLA